MNTLLALSGIALSWVFYGVTIVGLGAIFLQFIYRDCPVRISVCFWIGLTLLITILQLINLGSGINVTVVRSICLLGFLGFWFCRNNLDVTFWTRMQSWEMIAAALFLVWIMDRALAPVYVYDSGLYHFGSIRWANEQPLPPGLANLYGRLGLNQSYFLYAAFLNLLPKRGDGHTFANGLLVFFTLITLLETATNPVQERPVRTIARFLIPLLVFFALLWRHTSEPGLSSPSPDVALVCLQISIFSLALSALNRSRFGSPQENAAELMAILVLSPLAVTFKLSALVFSTGIWLFAMLAWLRRPKDDRMIRGLAGSLAINVVLSGTWIVRSIIASGYLIYPIASTGLPVSWRVAVDQVRNDYSWIVSWAREPGTLPSFVLGNSSWFGAWLHRVVVRPDFILCLSVLGFGLFLLLTVWIRNPAKARERVTAGKPFPALCLVYAASTAFWFLTAPDLRFLGAILALLALSSMGLTLNAVSSERVYSVAAIGTVLIFLIGFSVAFKANGIGLVTRRKLEIGSRIPATKLEQKVTASGLWVWVPITGDQTWDAPLPATPYFNENLSLRGAGLASGFCISAVHPGHDEAHP